MPLNRKYPHGSKKLIALDQDWFNRWFDGSQKVAVYWVTDPETVTVEGYYDTVSEANTAAAAAVSSGVYPKIAINWWHSDVEQRGVGPVNHPKAEEDLPSWIDTTPAY